MALLAPIFELIWGKSPFWVRFLIVLVLGPLALIGLGVGGYMAFDAWLISRVDTAVNPVRAELRSSNEKHDLEHRYMTDKLEGNLQLSKLIFEETLRNRRNP